MSTYNLAKWATLYDAVYASRGKRYDLEAAAVLQLAGERQTLLDVGCGTGAHLQHLERRLERTAGVDSDLAMLDVARMKLDRSRLVEADMTTMDLGERFEIITCLFAAIAYLPSSEAVGAALERMAAHLEPVGVLILEPGVTPDRLEPPRSDVMTFDADGKTWSRTTDASVQDERLHIRFCFRSTCGESFEDVHSIGLFDRAMYESALGRLGSVQWIEDGLNGRGVYVVERSE